MPTCPTCGSSTPRASVGAILFGVGFALGAAASIGGIWFMLTHFVVVQ